MARLEYRKEVLEKIVINYIQEKEKLLNQKEWKSFVKAFKNLNDVSVRIGIPFDPKFNSFHWAVDVYGLCHQILDGYCWMKAYADHYKSEVPEGELPAHTDFNVTYYADNCITRIDSSRDKIALMVWAYYCSFDPEKLVLAFEGIVERLKYQVKFGLVLKGAENFLGYLDQLKNGSFRRVKKYRHSKIHRREPRIEIYDVKPHHGLPYMFPLTKPTEIRGWRRSLAREHSDHSSRARIEKQCRIKGVLFEQRIVEDHLWKYEDLERTIKDSLVKLLVSSNGCFRVLRRRKPFRVS